ncbi:lmo0937 family membrane protein [Nostoc sp. TCL240-02]|uniref:lmo0937 family membrane protein n=1 Tax=Nostoc sp. TCL240-02 TaxID=2572090 RepID=UPI0020C73838|nr:lmo0937 family membrane protein [Nostoc sp. TCL240-02]
MSLELWNTQLNSDSLLLNSVSINAFGLFLKKDDLNFQTYLRTNRIKLNLNDKICEQVKIILVKVNKYMLGILWGIVVVLIAFWALGLALHIAGNLIHAVLLIAIALAIYNFFKARDV